MSELKAVIDLIDAPRESGKAVRVVLIRCATGAPPRRFGQWFIGSVLYNFLGNMPQDYWEKMKADAAKPCGKPGCDCHELYQQTLAHFEWLRAQFAARQGRQQTHHAE